MIFICLVYHATLKWANSLFHKFKFSLAMRACTRVVAFICSFGEGLNVNTSTCYTFVHHLNESSVKMECDEFS